MKICAGCGIEKSDEAFYVRGDKRGLRAKCRECHGVDNRAWRRANLDRCRVYTNRHRAKYPLRVLVRHGATRARAAGVESSLTEAEWVAILEEYDWACAYCLGPVTVLEHIVPISEGGAHSKENVVPACQACNIAKGKHSRSLVPHIASRFWPPTEELLRVSA